MHEIGAHVALITETWLKNTPYIDRQLQDMENALGFACIRKDRGGGRTGGGVAIIYKTGDLVMQQLKTGSDSEIVAALGRRIGQRRKIIVINAYVPPGIDAATSEEIIGEVADLVGTYKRKYGSPYFVIGGDFNKRNIAKELAVHADIKQVHTPPTRGDNTLDLVFTNFPQYITAAGVTDSIYNLEGTTSDHKTVYVNAKIPRVPEYNVEKYSYLKQTEDGDKKLQNYLESQDWGSLMGGCGGVDAMVEVLHTVFDKGMTSSYELKESQKKTTEPPWMTSGIRRLIRRRRAIFRKFGRNEVWKKMKRKTRRIIRDRRRSYNEEKKSRIMTGQANKFHDCVRAFVNNDKKKDWNPRSLYKKRQQKLKRPRNLRSILTI